MQFIDLKKQQDLIRKDIDRRIQKVLDHGKYILGPEVKELEALLADFVGVKHAIGVSNGTDALLIALMALDVHPGDKIITSPFTFFATAEVIRNMGAIPVFVDIDERNYNIDPGKLEKLLSESEAGEFAGIIPVDIFGQLADYDSISKIAEKYNLWILEDAAQSFGASQNSKMSCSFGNVATTSFFPAKPLGCYGDGGMVFTDDDKIAEKVLSIRVHGKGIDKYDNVRIGMNGRLDTIQAAVLLSKMQIFEEEIELRQQVVGRYNRLLEGIVKIPFVEENNISAWAQYCIQHKYRVEIISYLKEKNIPTAIYYPTPMHLLTAFKDLGYKKGDFPISEAVSEKIFSLPMYPYLEENEQKFILDSIKEAIENCISE